MSGRRLRLLVVLALVLGACDDEGAPPAGETRAASTTTTSITPPSQPPRVAGPERELGPGSVVGLSADGQAALVVAERPGSEKLGCEGLPDPFLFLVPLDGGKRSLATPGDEPVAGDVLRRPMHPGQVAIVDQCEEFLTAVYLAEEEAEGRLSRLEPVPLPDEQDQPTPRLSWSLDGRYLLGVRPDRGQVVRLDPATGAVETVTSDLPGVLQAVELAGGAIALLQPERLLLGDRSIPVRAFGLAVAPNGRDVAIYGEDGLLLVVSGRQPVEVEADSVTDASWSPDGTALTFVSGRALRAATTAGEVTGLAGDAASAGFFTPEGRAVVFTRTRPGDETVELSVSLLPLER